MSIHENRNMIAFIIRIPVMDYFSNRSEECYNFMTMSSMNLHLPSNIH